MDPGPPQAGSGSTAEQAAVPQSVAGMLVRAPATVLQGHGVWAPSFPGAGGPLLHVHLPKPWATAVAGATTSGPAVQAQSSWGQAVTAAASSPSQAGPPRSPQALSLWPRTTVTVADATTHADLRESCAGAGHLQGHAPACSEGPWCLSDSATSVKRTQLGHRTHPRHKS